MRQAFQRTAAFLCAVFLAVTGARAAEFAQTDLLGFSDDGAFFAFEEFGIQDGSGFPYSNIFIIDVANDTWVNGSPFRRVDEIGDMPPSEMRRMLSATRSANRAEANGLLLQTRIAGAGHTVAHNPPTEQGADPHHLIATPRLDAPAIGAPITLSLSEIPMASPASCPDGFGDIHGFRLELSVNGETRVLQEDTRIPSSRGCPLRYRIDRLITHQGEFGGPVDFAVLVLVERIGFEGPDGRYLAITGRL